MGSLVEEFKHFFNFVYLFYFNRHCSVVFHKPATWQYLFYAASLPIISVIKFFVGFLFLFVCLIFVSWVGGKSVVLNL